MDLFSTIIELAGGDPLPSLPSRSLATELEGKGGPHSFNEVYSEQEETRVLRTQDWVLFKRFKGHNAPDLPDALYASKLDPNERLNLVDDSNHQGILAELSARIDLYFDEHAKPHADIWKGGRPIQNSMLKPYWQSIWGSEWEPTYGYSDE